MRNSLPVRFLITGSLLLVLVASLLPAAGKAGSVADTLGSVLEEGRHPYARWGDFSDHQADLKRLYRGAGNTLLWTRGGRPSPHAGAVLSLLSEAPSYGLHPADYDARELAARMGELNPQTAAEELVLFDVGVSLSLTRFLATVHIGRIDPASVDFDLGAGPKTLNLPALVQGVARGDDLSATVSALEPRYPLYRRLKATLARARGLAAGPTLTALPDTGTVHPGDTFTGMAMLRRQLIAVGDLAPDAPASGEVYEGAVVDAVKKFQRRHGLDVDGIIGKNTLTWLSVPMERRVEQIELAIERMRWLPEVGDGPLIAVNVPEFRLRGFNVRDQAGTVEIQMPIIVGTVLHETPIFHGEVRYLVFSPYWNVPYSITRKELLPKIRRDPGHMAQQNLEIVDHFAWDATVYEPTAENLERLGSGALKLRQKPGPDNALGLVKFIFPNSNNVFLHSTPAQQLFDRSRRAFSHGCIRVEDPVALAEWVLRANGGWDEERIVAAMHASKPQQVNLDTRIPVYILYTTVVVEADGTVRGFEDLYGHDARLRKLLAAGYPYAS